MSENHQQLVDRATKAKALLDSDLLKEAFAEVDKAIFASLKATRPEEREARERLYLAMGTAEHVQTLLRGWLGNGQMAADVITRLKKR